MHNHEKHLAHIAAHRPSAPCTAHDSRIGGGCFNCGFNPEADEISDDDLEAAAAFYDDMPRPFVT